MAHGPLRPVVADRAHRLGGAVLRRRPGPRDAGVLLPLVAPVRLVLANIISSVLVALLPAVRAALEDAWATGAAGQDEATEDFAA